MPDHASDQPPLIGDRISVVGTSSNGKSTLAQQLAELIDGTYIELDALHWLPDWQESTTEDFQVKVTAAINTAPRWAVAGNYNGKGIPDIVLAQADTWIWIDLGFRVSFTRLLRRTWRRWRDQELLWGNNRERFWEHFKLWSNDSLPGFVLRNYRASRRRQADRFADPRWTHLQRHHLRSPAEVARFLDQVEAERAARDRT
ncbi:MAG: adenylate kinase [Dehalococcoidia bacterium]|jgi:adenylate kinase family enzyme|nr:adenylate kinase [Dehalococcoidia bacterium]